MDFSKRIPTKKSVGIFLAGGLVATIVGGGLYSANSCDGHTAMLRGAFSQSAAAEENSLVMDSNCQGRIVPKAIIERAPIFGG